MSLQSFSGGLQIPPNDTSTGSRAWPISAAGHKFACIVKVPKTGNISKVRFKTGTVTSSQSIDIRLETVDAATGYPTGTLYGGSAAGVEASPASNTVYTTTLATAAAATAGDTIAVVFQFTATAGSLNFLSDGASWTFPYVASYGASWSKGAFLPGLLFEYDDGTYPFMGTSADFSGATAFGSDTTDPGDEVGNLFNLPFKCRAVGYWWYGDTINGDHDIILYDGSNNVLASISHDKDVCASSARNYRHALFSSPIQINANSDYRLIAKPTSTSTIGLYATDYVSEAVINSAPLGAKVRGTARYDAGSWTNSYKRWSIGLLIDQLSDDAGGGGGNMRGGFVN